jgi:hypothetical protein
MPPPSIAVEFVAGKMLELAAGCKIDCGLAI